MERTNQINKDKVQDAVRVKRVEYYGCGCTTTRIRTSSIDQKYAQSCKGHGEHLTKVVTVMEYLTEQENLSE